MSNNPSLTAPSLSTTNGTTNGKLPPLPIPIPAAILNSCLSASGPMLTTVPSTTTTSSQVNQLSPQSKQAVNTLALMSTTNNLGINNNINTNNHNGNHNNNHNNHNNNNHISSSNGHQSPSNSPSSTQMLNGSSHSAHNRKNKRGHHEVDDTNFIDSNPKKKRVKPHK